MLVDGEVRPLITLYNWVIDYLWLLTKIFIFRFFLDYEISNIRRIFVILFGIITILKINGCGNQRVRVELGLDNWQRCPLSLEHGTLVLDLRHNGDQGYPIIIAVWIQRLTRWRRVFQIAIWANHFWDTRVPLHVNSRRFLDVYEVHISLLDINRI